MEKVAQIVKTVGSSANLLRNIAGVGRALFLIFRLLCTCLATVLYTALFLILEAVVAFIFAPLLLGFGLMISTLFNSLWGFSVPVLALVALSTWLGVCGGYLGGSVAELMATMFGREAGRDCETRKPWEVVGIGTRISMAMSASGVPTLVIWYLRYMDPQPSVSTRWAIVLASAAVCLAVSMMATWYGPPLMY